ncbi:hypothetical protein N7532_009721 [Penicillium argentinense]|uniref:Uncharacterized protein n=1 Tax=Penicillium argentinense TaxID=1131581 RepID=A0A9W9K3R4_9EURO|nr:uncharacterized protein N7532_009721 [Penicillium argentinense]KAJ5091037.1 hypothetical protein N7532_009721 [Penicillium argentinense]
MVDSTQTRIQGSLVTPSLGSPGYPWLLAGFRREQHFGHRKLNFLLQPLQNWLIRNGRGVYGQKGEQSADPGIHELVKPPSAPELQPRSPATIEPPTANPVGEQPFYRACIPPYLLLTASNLQVVAQLVQQVLPQQSELVIIVSGRTLIEGHVVDLLLQSAVGQSRRHSLAGNGEDGYFAEILPIVVVPPTGMVALLWGDLDGHDLDDVIDAEVQQEPGEPQLGLLVEQSLYVCVDEEVLEDRRIDQIADDLAHELSAAESFEV